MDNVYTTPVGFHFWTPGRENKKRSVFISDPLSASRIDENTLLTGPQSADDKCMTCAQGYQKCPNHLGSYSIYPVPYPMSYAALKKIAPIICSECSRIALSFEERSFIMERKAGLGPEDVREALMSKGPDYLCPFCRKPLRVFHPVGFPVGIGMDFSRPALYYVGHPSLGNRKEASKLSYSQLPIADNRYLMDKLEGIPSNDLLIMSGLSIEYYHPRTYIKDIVEITMPSAKTKAHPSMRFMGTKTKKLYSLIEEFQMDIGKKLAGRTLQHAQKDMAGDPEGFNQLILSIHYLYYAICILHWKLPDRLMSAVNSVFQLGAQKPISHLKMLQRKGGIPRKYVAGSRHDKNVRTPLTGAVFGSIGTVNFPREFAMKLDQEVMINPLNIEFMRYLVRNGPKVYPGANGYIRFGTKYNLLGQNLDAVAANLISGDIVLRHLITGDVVLHGRYPSIREESIGASIINVTDGRLIQMTISECEMMMADFDGDDTQCFCPSSFGVMAEAIILMSIIRHFIAPYDGRASVSISDELNPDVIMGYNYLMQKESFNQREINAIYSALFTDTSTPIGKKSYTAKDIIESIIPRAFYFDARQNGIKSDLLIEDGFIVTGTVGIGAFRSGDTHLLRSIASATDTYTAIKVLEDISRIAYKINEMYGNSCADDTRIIPGPCKKIREYVKERVQLMTEYSYQFHRGRIPIPAGQDPQEYFENMMNFVHANRYSLEILEQVREIMKGTSLQRAGYAKEYEAKLVPAFSSRGIILFDGHRPRMELCHSNRHNAFFPKGYDGPEAGYVEGNYLRRLSPLEHFLEGAAGRQDVYTKAGASVQETGYYHRKMYMSIGALYIGYLGEVRGHSATIISFSYGHTGADSRSAVDMSIDAHLISDKEFRARYDGVPEEFALLRKIREDWQHCIMDYIQVTSDEEYDPGEKVFKAPFNVQAFFEQFRSREKATAPESAKLAKPATATEIWAILRDMDQKLIDMQLGPRAGPFAREIAQERVRAFMRLFRFTASTNYFLKEKWSIDFLRRACQEMSRKYIASMVQPGDVVGTKAALNITSSLYQSTLHAGRGFAMLGKSIDLIRRTHGITSLREVTEGLHPKFPITMCFLDDDKRFNYSASMEIARANSSVKLSEALVTGYFYSVSPDHISPQNCANNLFLRWIKNLPPASRKLFEKSSHSWFYITLHLNHTSLLINRVNPALIAPTLREQFSDIVDEAIPIYENEAGMYVILMLKSTLTYDEMRSAFDTIIDTGIIHGHPALTNGTVKEYSKYPDFGGDGSLKYKKAYRIMFNGSDLSYLLALRDVDKSTIVTSDVVGSVDKYGIEEGRFRAYEIIAFESTTIAYLARLLRRHIHVVVNYMAYRGTMTYVPRAAVGSNPDINEIDKIVFETADVFLGQAIQMSKTRKIDSLMSSMLFGKAPTIGSGISEVLLNTRDLFPSRAKEVAVEAMERIPKAKKSLEKKAIEFHNSIMSLPMNEASEGVELEL